jgi:hypothetical protein
MSIPVPKFTVEQLYWLDQVAFRENTTDTVDPNVLFIRLGQRQVVDRIRSAIEQAKARALK